MDKELVSVADIKEGLSALSKRQATVSYGLIGILLVVLALAGLGAYLGASWSDKLFARAEKQEQVFKDTLKLYQDELSIHRAERERMSQQQGAIGTRIIYRDREAEQTKAEVVAPKPIQDVAKDAEKHLNELPEITPTLRLAFYPPTVQGFIVNKIERDQFAANNTDLKEVLRLEQEKTISLNKDLGAANKTLGEAGKTITDYKRAAKASKFKRILRGALTAGALAGAGYAGYKLGRR